MTGNNDRANELLDRYRDASVAVRDAAGNSALWPAAEREYYDARAALARALGVRGAGAATRRRSGGREYVVREHAGPLADGTPPAYPWAVYLGDRMVGSAPTRMEAIRRIQRGWYAREAEAP